MVIRLFPLVLTSDYSIMYAVLPRVILKPEEWLVALNVPCVNNMGDKQEWGFVLIDARNAFSTINRTVMLTRHEWPSGARFYFIATNIMHSGNQSKFQVKKSRHDLL